MQYLLPWKKALFGLENTGLLEIIKKNGIMYFEYLVNSSLKIAYLVSQVDASSVAVRYDALHELKTTFFHPQKHLIKRIRNSHNQNNHCFR